MSYEDDILAGLYAPTPNQAFEQKLTQPTVGVPAADVPPTFLERMGMSARRLAANPIAQGIGGLVHPMAPLAMREGLGTRSPVSFERDNQTVTSPGGTLARLTPIEPGATADTDIAAAPTLDPRYQLKKPGMLAGPGGMGSGNGLQAAFNASQQKLLDDYDTDKHLQYVQGANRADEIAGRSALQVQEAAIKQRYADLQEKADVEAAQKHEAFLARNQQLADEIGEKRTSVEHVVGDAVGDIGMVVGGMLMAKSGNLDQAWAQFNKRLDRKMAEQQQELEGKKLRLAARQSTFGQMLQETGDRRLAAMQTRNLALEAVKQKLTADADRLGIPSVKTNADMAVNKIQHEKDQLDSAIKGRALEVFQAQQRAAAAAAAAAEEKAYRRMQDERKYRLDVAELGIKATEAEAKNKDAGTKQTNDFENRVQSLGKDLADKDLADGRAAVESAKQRLMRQGADEGLPGVGAGADLRDKIAPKPTGAAALNPGAWANYAVAGLNDDERISRGDWEKVKLAYQKQITGSGASEKEREMISKAFEGNKSAAEQRHAIQIADDFFQQMEQRKMAAYPENVQAEFKRRLGAQGGPKE